MAMNPSLKRCLDAFIHRIPFLLLNHCSLPYSRERVVPQILASVTVLEALSTMGPDALVFFRAKACTFALNKTTASGQSIGEVPTLLFKLVCTYLVNCPFSRPEPGETTSLSCSHLSAMWTIQYVRRVGMFILGGFTTCI